MTIPALTWMDLGEIATLVYSGGTGWRELVMTHIDQLHCQRAWIDATLTALQSAMACPRDHPLLECSDLIDALDEWVEGARSTLTTTES